MKTLPLPSYEELHELFDLDAEKGILIWKKMNGNRNKCLLGKKSW